MRPSPLLAPMLLSGALLSLAACNDRDSGTTVSINAENGTALASANGSTGEVKVDLPGFQGTLKLPKVQLKSDDFDLNGVRLYPGSTIEGFNVDAGGGKDNGRVRVSFTSPAAPATVRDWLLTRLNGANFSVTADGNGLTGTTDDHKPFRLELTPAGADHAKGTITMGS